MEAHEKKPTPDFYLGSGKWLIDKDRNINSDLVEIHDFFEPLDRLFGDYETRRKLNLHEYLYRRDFDGKEIAINKVELEKYNKDEHVGDNYQFILFSIKLEEGEYKVAHQWLSVSDMINRNYQLQEYCIAHYILDPVKLRQIIHLDKSRFDYACETFWKKNKELEMGQDKSQLNQFIENYAFVKNFFKRHRRYFGISSGQSMSVGSLKEIGNEHANYLAQKSDLIEAINEKIVYLTDKDGIQNPQDIIDALEEEKVKSFERFNEVRIRLGMYQNGRLVLFLHPYESESNNPGRIPAEE